MISQRFSLLRRKLLGAVALTFVAGFGAVNVAQADTLDDVRKSGVIKIGTEGVYAPYSYHDDKGNLTGYDVEVARALAQKLGVKAVFVETLWDGMIAGLDVKRFDIVVNQMVPNPERRAKFLFTKPYTYIKGSLIVQKNNNTIKDFEHLKGLRAAQTVTSNWGKLAASLGAELVNASQFPEAIQLLATGRADFIINSDLSTLDFLRHKPDAPIKIVAEWKDPIEIAIPVRHGDERLQAALNKAIDELQADGTLSKLAVKYLGKDATKK